MARRRKNQDELQENKVPSLSYSTPSQAYSDDALNALASGNYREFRKSGVAARRNEQAKQGYLKKKEWRSENDIPSLVNARQYQQNLDDRQKSYEYDEQARKNNTLEKREGIFDWKSSDQDYLQRIYDNYGEEGARRALYQSNRTKDWEKKYGKSYDQILNDFLADQKNVTMQMGESHPFITEAGTILNSVPNALVTLPSLITNLVDPESPTAKKYEQMRANTSENQRLLREGVKKNTGNVGDKVIDTINGVGDRMANTIIGNQIAPGLGAVMAGLSDANTQLDDLDLRGVTGRQKYASALTHGAVEGIGTAITGGLLDKIPAVEGVKGALLNIGKGAGNAAIENTISELVEMGADTAINKEQSQKELNKSMYMAQGMSENEAERQAFLDQAKQAGNAALMGALFGGGMRGITEVGNAFRGGSVPAPDGVIPDDAVSQAAKNADDIPTVKTNNVEVPPTEAEIRAELDANKKVAPEQPKGLHGEEFDKAKAEFDANKKTISDLQKENKSLKQLKQTKANKAKIADNDAKIKDLKRNNVLLDRSIYGKPTPVIEQLDSGTVDNLNYLKRQIKDAGNMFAGENGKTLAEEANAALDRYIESGNVDDYVDFTNKVQALDDASRGNTYTVKTGKNKGQVRTFEESYPDGSLMSLIKSREGYLEGEMHDPTFKALEDVYDFHKQKNSAPAEPDVPTVKPTDVPQQEVPNVKPVEANGEEKVRSFSKRGSMDEELPEEVRNSLSEDTYRVVRNADTSARAEEMFDPENLAQTHSNLKQSIEKHDPASALLAYKLAKSYVDNGDYDSATDVLEEVSKELTRMGQFTQAAKLAMMQNDPMAALRSYERELQKLNQWGSKKYKGKWNNLKLDKEDIDLFNSVQKGDSEGLNNVVDQLNAKFGKQIPASKWDKVVSASKTAMLLNFRTQARNVLANMATLPIRSASDRVSALGQNIVHLFDPDTKVTQSMTGGTKAQKKIATEIWDKYKGDITGENKMKDSVQSDILGHRQIFNNDAFAEWIDNLTDGAIQKLNQKFGADGNTSTMETLQNLTYWLMGDVGDTPFVKKNFVNRLASYMKAQGIDNIEDVPDDAIAIATQEALKATFKDDNAFTKALQGVKQKSGKFGEVALPFVKTPANLTMRAVDYSPAGLINTFRKIRSGAEADAVIDDLSKNLTGTAMIYLGYKLAEKGLISGTFSKDKDEASFQKQQGMLEYAVHIPDDVPVIGGSYLTYDWTQPAATPLVIGTTIYEAVKNSDKENASIKDIANGVYKGGLNVANTVLNSSPLQSLSDLLGDDGTDEGGIAGNIMNEIIEFPQRLIPSVLGATARTIDPVMRDTYMADNDTLTGILGNQARSAVAKIPYLSKMLPASYDTWGNERTRSDSVPEAFVAQMVNPGQLGNENITPLDSEIQRIYDATGNAKVFPRNVARSLNLGGDGNTVLTNKQHSDYQKLMGQTSYKYAESLMNNEDFKSLTDDEKAAVLDKAYGLANDLAKEKLFDHVTTSNKELKEFARSHSPKEIAQYLMDGEKAKSLGMNRNTYEKKEAEYDGGAVAYAQNKQTAEDLGISTSTYDKVLEKAGQHSAEAEQALPVLAGMGLPTNALYTYANALQDYEDIDLNEFAQTYSEMNTDGSNGLKEKEILDYINSFEYDDPSEAEDLWYMYSDFTNKKGERKKIKNVDGVWKSYY